MTLKGNNVSKEILEKAIQNQEMEGSIVDKFELEVIPIGEKEIQSLLFYFGYLTIKENKTNTIIKYKIPNQVMSGIYNEYFLPTRKYEKVYCNICGRKIGVVGGNRD